MNVFRCSINLGLLLPLMLETAPAVLSRSDFESGNSGWVFASGANNPATTNSFRRVNVIYVDGHVATRESFNGDNPWFTASVGEHGYGVQNCWDESR